MKFKEILLENKNLEKLKEFLGGGKYNFKKPYIWRGRTKDRKKIMEKKTHGIRKPVDTKNYIDYFIEEFRKNCFSQFPSRRKSRFGSTSKKVATVYGSHIYLIIPSKNAKIAYSEREAFSYLDKAHRRIQDGVYKIFRNYATKNDLFKSFISNQSFQLYRDVVKAYRKDDFQMDIDITRHGCPSDIAMKFVKMAKKVEVENDSRESLIFGLENIAEGFHLINEFYRSLSVGYPESNSGEVIFEGEYLQIHESLFEKYKEKFRHEI